MEFREANFVVEIGKSGPYQNCWSCPLKFVLSAPGCTEGSSVCFKKPCSLFSVLHETLETIVSTTATLESVLGTPQWPWSLDAPPNETGAWMYSPRCPWSLCDSPIGVESVAEMKNEMPRDSLHSSTKKSTQSTFRQID